MDQPQSEPISKPESQTCNCGSCGSSNRVGSLFCGKCGADLMGASMAASKSRPIGQWIGGALGFAAAMMIHLLVGTRAFDDIGQLCMEIGIPTASGAFIGWLWNLNKENKLHRGWLGLALGLTFSLGLEIQHYFLMKTGWLKFSYRGINWGALDHAVPHKGYFDVNMNQLSLWDSIDLFNVVFPVTCLAGIIGYLYQRKLDAKREAEELMVEMNSKKNKGKAIFADDGNEKLSDSHQAQGQSGSKIVSLLRGRPMKSK
jgi:hypothetical protein